MSSASLVEVLWVQREVDPTQCTATKMSVHRRARNPINSCTAHTYTRNSILLCYNFIKLTYLLTSFLWPNCLKWFDTVGWASGRASCLYKTEWWGAAVVICLERSANDLHMVQLMPLPPIISRFIKIQNWFCLSGTGLLKLSWKRGR